MILKCHGCKKEISSEVPSYTVINAVLVCAPCAVISIMQDHKHVREELTEIVQHALNGIVWCTSQYARDEIIKAIEEFK